jgi:hypothetical protein
MQQKLRAQSGEPARGVDPNNMGQVGWPDLLVPTTLSFFTN